MDQLSEERIRALRNEQSFFIPIIKILQENGGELEGVSQIDKLIPSYTDFTENEINFTKITEKGNKYTPYWFGRNFALKNLSLAGILTYGRNMPIKLTTDGLNIDANAINFEQDIYAKSRPYWEKKAEERKNRKADESTIEDLGEQDVSDLEKEVGQGWRNDILEAILNLNPYRFEQFSRGLLKRMGFDIDLVKGINKSGDGGIDGFAYCLDEQSLKTTRVAIQCKKYRDNPVGSADINNLRGAVDTHRADYGIFITTSYYSKDAIESSRAGGTPVTLIDGNKLIDLMIKYNFKVKEVVSYIADTDYFEA
ncbi:restriction endonuclease [uncultured Ruminococcus sp.]|uniref:restriction endonuclease n=1 Tax=uncultured Ruminococcus sp. TaxID=165186 RepID=UPI0025DD55A0|nr:restriction endonuclease [uncultured Ruminococcus sp.]